MKRILDCHASDFAAMSGRELLAAIAGSEGRTIACETIGALMPMLGDITNAEFAAAMGADILLLNLFDVQHPVIRALPECAPEDTVRKLKALTGRPVGINLEPIDEEIAGQREGMWAMTDGRVATLENARRASDMGVDMILLTGNPGMGVKNAAIERTLRLYRRELGERIILAAGKMHAAGVLGEGAQNIITREDVRAFVEAGADIILLPEIPYDLDVVCDALRDRAEHGKTFSIIAVAEGAMSVDEAKMKKKERAAYRQEIGFSGIANYLAKVIQEKMPEIEARAVIPGHMQRGGSPSAYDRMLSTNFGVHAAQLIAGEQYGQAVGMTNNVVTHNPLSTVAGKTKFVPRDGHEIRAARAMGISLGDKQK